MLKKLWKMWANAIGSKVGNTDLEADRVAFIRTIIVLQAFITNLFIIAGIIKHWSE